MIELNIGHLSLFISLALLGALFIFGSRFGKLELKVNTMWDFLLRRALSEGVKGGWLTHESSARLTSKARDMLNGTAGLMGDIFAFVRQCRQKSDKELFLLIEAKFGERLLHDVCLPQGMMSGECVLAVIELCREFEQRLAPQ